MAGIEDLNKQKRKKISIPTPGDLGITHPMLIDYPGRQQQIEAKIRRQQEQGRISYTDEINKRARRILEFNESGASQEEIDKNLRYEFSNTYLHNFGNKNEARQAILDKIEILKFRRQGPSNSMERNLMQQEQLGFAQGGVVTDIDIFS
tara:strand:- start:252 stop:698 length:447 start_codon:yes stop_codon:yes gene_type:complete